MKQLLFDLWGTLAYIEEGGDFVKEIAIVLGTTKSKYRAFVVNTWYKEGLTAEEFLQRASLEFRRNLDMSLIDLLLEPIKRVKLYPDVVPNLKKLMHEKRLFLVSDTTPIGGECINQLEITNYFESIHLSFEYGVTK